MTEELLLPPASAASANRSFWLHRHEWAFGIVALVCLASCRLVFRPGQLLDNVSDSYSLAETISDLCRREINVLCGGITWDVCDRFQTDHDENKNSVPLFAPLVVRRETWRETGIPFDDSIVFHEEQCEVAFYFSVKKLFEINTDGEKSLQDQVMEQMLLHVLAGIFYSHLTLRLNKFTDIESIESQRAIYAVLQSVLEFFAPESQEEEIMMTYTLRHSNSTLTSQSEPELTRISLHSKQWSRKEIIERMQWAVNTLNTEENNHEGHSARNGQEEESLARRAMAQTDREKFLFDYLPVVSKAIRRLEHNHENDSVVDSRLKGHANKHSVSISHGVYLFGAAETMNYKLNVIGFEMAGITAVESCLWRHFDDHTLFSDECQLALEHAPQKIRDLEMVPTNRGMLYCSLAFLAVSIFTLLGAECFPLVGPSFSRSKQRLQAVLADPVLRRDIEMKALAAHGEEYRDNLMKQLEEKASTFDAKAVATKVHKRAVHRVRMFVRAGALVNLIAIALFFALGLLQLKASLNLAMMVVVFFMVSYFFPRMP